MKNLVLFLKKIFDLIYFLSSIIVNKNIHDQYKRIYSGTAAILATGPSIKSVLPGLATKSECNNIDFISMNTFALDETFFTIKPKHYCLADLSLFTAIEYEHTMQKLFSVFENSVSWKMNLYILSTMKKHLDKFKLTNDNISIIAITPIEYRGFECFRNFFYKSGFALPSAGTVAVFAIFIGLNSGYSKLLLYGVDHSFFDISMNEKNQLCIRYVHFNDGADNITMKLKYNFSTGKVWRMSEYCYDMFLTFSAHDKLSNYAKHLGVEIINCTPGSFIDSYVREKVPDLPF
jgi:hypothetical protein